MSRASPSLFERSVALGLLAGSVPVLVAASVAIVAFGGGNPLFAQSRVGLDRQTFTVLKLRTMSQGVVTPVGRALRRTKVDELPQLLNIVRGEMRFVGPRPITQYDVRRLGWHSVEHDPRWAVAPGITGPTQLSTICDADLAARRDRRFAAEAGVTDEIELLILSLARPIVGAQRIASRVERWT
ncbi:MAG: O-antigen biosynthesis protein WbqP [Bradymonadia bacterium]